MAASTAMPVSVFTRGNKEVLPVKKLSIFGLIPLILVGCAASEVKSEATAPAFASQTATPLDQARDLFCNSRISSANVVDEVSTLKNSRAIQATGEIDANKVIAVRLEGDLEWPLPYDKDDLRGEVRGKHALILFDRDTKHFTYIKMSKEAF